MGLQRRRTVAAGQTAKLHFVSGDRVAERGSEVQVVVLGIVCALLHDRIASNKPRIAGPVCQCRDPRGVWPIW